MSDIKSHWYAFTFRDKVGYKSTFMGYDEKDQITANRIQEASEFAHCVDNSTCIISIVYLGYMTVDKFNNEGEYDGIVTTI